MNRKTDSKPGAPKAPRGWRWVGVHEVLRSGDMISKQDGWVPSGWINGLAWSRWRFIRRIGGAK